MKFRRIVAATAMVLASAAAAPLAATSASATSSASFRSDIAWSWAFGPSYQTSSRDQYVSANVRGTASANRNAALVVRRTPGVGYALVNLSGTRYQIVVVLGSRRVIAVNRPFLTHGGGVVRAEVVGTRITTWWNGRRIATDNVPLVGRLSGTNASVAVWQDAPYSVFLSNVKAGHVKPTPGGPNATPTPTPTPTPTSATPTPTSAPPTVTSAPTPTPTPTTPTAPTTTTTTVTGTPSATSTTTAVATVPVVTPTTPVPAAAPAWKSGASGDGVANGAFGAWRGRPVDIAGTWNDGYEAQINLWTVQPGAEYADWQGDLDIAIGAVFKDRGESWAQAATGAYDARWSQSLQTLKTAWGSKPGTVYIRFAHEFNGDWYGWSVNGTEASDFVAAWKRFRALQKQIMPQAQLVFCPSAQTSGTNKLDWRTAFPGAAYVDVMSVDYYNQWPWVNTAADFTSNSLRTDWPYGAPLGVETHRQFAESVGLPFAISEWGDNAGQGDAPEWYDAFHSWMAANAGSGPGKLLYEIQFNVTSFGPNTYSVYPTTNQPLGAARYLADW